ncbi:altronate dehydratase family protein [Olsenella sp. YH-ols2217]|uniref:Altronate dehydratase family protein n=1 Tax=Kribbibacterium absianum TaxID=3044210 RepID=A0ABT6ZML9_9ACTN|nr:MULTISPECIES: altronate dehydratase family protein [unclassified Olsenella]MDJ1122277.1 altronate dehydratase family protein [Olsenella sp. YH-ols2216]MDJ1130309.1 altronate dehydratase family protein [Olsenella sp. YH-ols2217]
MSAAMVQIAPGDSVAVALRDLAAGETVPGPDGCNVELQDDVPRGHKVALTALDSGDPVVKYGAVIGHATRPLERGQWVHTHDLATSLSGTVEYRWEPEAHELARPAVERTFQGYRRADGRVGTRNELWIIPVVGCVNDTAAELAAEAQGLVGDGLEAVVAFSHPYGCSQMGDDLARTAQVLASLAHHPNAGGVLLLSLGCENVTQEMLFEALGSLDPERVRYLRCQDVEDELAAGLEVLGELADVARRDRREAQPLSELVLGLKCGGSDGLSGITANPVIGRVSDAVVAAGGTSLLAEVPEMFGAEGLLLGRCESREVFDEACDLLNGFKEYFLSHGAVVYENPSPGNKAGGITTLEDKSCGCVQKGGTAPVSGVVGYGDRVERKGLNLLCSPGNDLVSSTALSAAGATVILFSTGRGTPFGAPAPTVKVASNSALAQKKHGWVDFDAGRAVSEGLSLDVVADELLDKLVAVASGELTSAEHRGARGLAIWKDGVTL